MPVSSQRPILTKVCEIPTWFFPDRTVKIFVFWNHKFFLTKLTFGLFFKFHICTRDKKCYFYVWRANPKRKVYYLFWDESTVIFVYLYCKKSTKCFSKFTTVKTRNFYQRRRFKENVFQKKVIRLKDRLRIQKTYVQAHKTLSNMYEKCF